MGPQFVSLSELRQFTLAEGATAQALFGEQAMLNLVELAPHARVPRHVFQPIREDYRSAAT